MVPISTFNYEWVQLLVAGQRTTSNLVCLEQSFADAQRLASQELREGTLGWFISAPCSLWSQQGTLKSLRF